MKRIFVGLLLVGVVGCVSDEKPLTNSQAETEELANSTQAKAEELSAQASDTGSDPDAPARRLTDAEVESLFADEIGTWKLSGQVFQPGQIPNSNLPDYEHTMVIRWKEKGKSIDVHWVEVPLAGSKEYDAEAGVFIWRMEVESQPEIVTRETYNPKTKTYRGQTSMPDGTKETRTMVVVNKNKKIFKIKVEDEGKVIRSEKIVFTRMEEDMPASDAAEKVIPGTK